MDVLEEGNLEPAPVNNDEVVAVPNPIVDKVLDRGEDEIVVPPQIMDIERARRAVSTHDAVNEIIRREKVMITSPPVYEGVRSAQDL